jgi:hypothetical protein
VGGEGCNWTNTGAWCYPIGNDHVTEEVMENALRDYTIRKIGNEKNSANV